jgi:hypothetical protein
MTELDWLRSADACVLLEHLFPQRGLHSTPPQPRKLRLYFAALCRAAWGRLPPVCRALTEFAERRADSPRLPSAVVKEARHLAETLTTCWGNPEDVAECERAARALGLEVPVGGMKPVSDEDGKQLAWVTFLAHWNEVPPYRWLAPAYHRADYVRDPFGNPFRPITFDPAWRTHTAVSIAERMYDARTFGAMPVLADALEEAGCHDADILAHCRDDASHVRGCWVVDLLLGKG